MTDIKFRPLFTVELLHGYYTDTFCPDFTIVPSIQTAAVLRGCKMVWKQNNNQLVVGIQAVSSDGTNWAPFAQPSTDTPLTFFLQCKNALFFNYTSIPRATDNGYLYYFSNRNDNSHGKKFLTAALPKYIKVTGTESYMYEDLVVDSNTTYQSINSKNIDGVDSTSWRALGSDSFTSAEDLFSWIPSISQITYTAVPPPFNIDITGYDKGGNQITITKTVTNLNSPTSFLLDLSGLQSGRYLLSINGEKSYPVYLNDELSNTNVFAVIDIYFNGISEAYKMIDVNNNLLSPLYSIFFLNRSTFWKYIFTTTNHSAIIESTDVYKFNSPPATTFISSFPIPLSQAPLTVQLDSGGPKLPCAGVDRLAGDTASTPVYYSEIFLNQ